MNKQSKFSFGNKNLEKSTFRLVNRGRRNLQICQGYRNQAELEGLPPPLAEGLLLRELQQLV